MEEDKALLISFRDPASREKAFTSIVTNHQKQLYWQIRRMVVDHDDANDVLQNVFIKAWNGLPSFREDSKLSTWLYRIAANESITFLNTKRNKLFLSAEQYDMQLADKVCDDHYFRGDQIQRKLQRAILTLPEKQRIVFNLKYFDEMKYEDMSEVLDTSVGALKASYHHAVKKIEEFLKAD